MTVPALTLVPVGVVHSSLSDRRDAPRQGKDAGTEAELEVFLGYVSALEGLRAGGRIQVVCWLHQARRDLLSAHPRGDGSLPLAGVFSTRSPDRPNPLAVYAAELLAVTGNRLRVRGLDAIDGTPVIDIRPFIPRLDE